jgi:hypothetical protein
VPSTKSVEQAAQVFADRIGRALESASG